MRWLHWHVFIADYKYPTMICLIILIILSPIIGLRLLTGMIHNHEVGVDKDEIITGDNDYDLAFHFRRHEDAIKFARIIDVFAKTTITET